MPHGGVPNAPAVRLPIPPIEAVLSGRLDAGFVAAVTPWNKDLERWEFARDRILAAVPEAHPLTRRGKIRLRDLRDMPFIWFQRSANPTFNDLLTQECARVGLGAPRIVQRKQRA